MLISAPNVNGFAQSDCAGRKIHEALLSVMKECETRNLMPGVFVAGPKANANIIKAFQEERMSLIKVDRLGSGTAPFANGTMTLFGVPILVNWNIPEEAFGGVINMYFNRVDVNVARPMWSYSICYRCMSRSKTDATTADILWNNGIGFCHKRGICDIKRKPPQDCPYLTEHVVSMQCSLS